MRMLTFANRNTKEILRDPLTLFFGLGFPLILILLLSAIQANIPVKLFEIQHLTPGITVFGLAFMTLFSATIIAKDRGSSLLQRLYTTPLTPLDFILGYTLPIIPISVSQCVVCYIAAIVLGLDITINILYAVLCIIPVSILYIALGLLCGSLLTHFLLSMRWICSGRSLQATLSASFLIYGGCSDMPLLCWRQRYFSSCAR